MYNYPKKRLAFIISHPRIHLGYIIFMKEMFGFPSSLILLERFNINIVFLCFQHLFQLIVFFFQIFNNCNSVCYRQLL